MEKFVCLYDNKEFKSRNGFLNHLKKKYNKSYGQYLIEVGLGKEDDFVKCEECGQYCSTLNVHIRSFHKKEFTLNEYKLKWKPLKIVGEITRKKLSDNTKGENNPMHKSKTTEEQRKRQSPFSIEFYRDKFPELTEEELKIKVKEFAKDAQKDTISSTKLEYWINKCDGNIEEAKILYKKRQSTFSLIVCKEKYGEEEGTRIYRERQRKWNKSLLENGNCKYGYSKISQDLFLDILENILNKDDIFFAINNEEYIIESYRYDFVDIKNKKIIEYNGDLYHANPNKYGINDTPNPYRRLHLKKFGKKINLKSI